MTTKQNERAPVAPLLLGPRNAEAAVGASWRWVRDLAGQLGVPRYTVGRKSFVDAEAFLAAVRATSARPGAELPVPADPAAALRAMLGLRRRTPADNA